MTIIGYKRLRLVCFVLLATLLGSTVYLRLKYARLDAEVSNSLGAIQFYQHTRDFALRGDPATAVELLGFLPSPGWGTNGPLGWLVAQERERAASEVIQYLRQRTGEDWGPDPAKWIEKLGKFSHPDFRWRTPLAYRFVASEALVHRFNHYASRMHLPIEVPVKEADIRVLNVSRAPYQYRYSIRVKNYSFGFNDRALQLYKPDEYHSLNVWGMERASRMPYVVNTNDTYRMATNWLAALDVDLVSLEKSNPPCVNRNPIFESERGPVPNPVLGVDWHNPTTPGYDSTEVAVEISAVSGDLIKLIDKGGDFSKRPALIRDVGKLLAISDEEFLKYSPLERSNLLVRFAGVHGPLLSDASLFRAYAVPRVK